MYYGLLSGILWAVDTVILGVALGMSPYVDSAQASFASAFMHDFFAAAVLLVMMAQKGRLKDTLEAAKTKSGRVVMLGALLGGPIGMSGYLAAINTIGPGYTAAISAFYPAVGSLLAWLLLKEKMNLKQIMPYRCSCASWLLVSQQQQARVTETFLWVSWVLLHVSLAGALRR